MKSKITMVAMAAAAAVSLTACSGSGGGTAQPTASDEPFVVAYVGGVTGSLASTTATEIEAMKAGVEFLNDNGGVNGHPVELEVLDSKSDPTEAVTVLQQRLAKGDAPDLIKAGITSPEALAILPVAARAGIASYTISNSPLIDDVDAYPLNRSVSAIATQQVEVVWDYIQAQDYQSISVLAPENATGDALVQSVESVFKGVEVTETRYAPAELDVTASYERALQGSPDAVFTDCIGQLCANILSARDAVPGAVDVPLLGTSPLSGSAGGPAAIASPSAIQNLHMLVFDVQYEKPEAEQTEAFQTFYSALLAADPDPTGVLAPSTAWDGLMMFAHAADVADSIDGADMIAAIDDIDWEPGFFATYGDVPVDFSDKSVYPTVPNNGFAMVQASAQVKGLYPAVDLFVP